MRRLIYFGLISLMTACGGGGGGDEPNPVAPGNNTTANLTIRDASVLFEAFESDNRSFREVVRVDVSQRVIDEANDGRQLFFVISQTDPSFNTITAQVLSTHGNLIIETPFTDQLEQEQYSSVVTVRGCYDNNCSEEFGRSTIQLGLNKITVPRPSAVLVDTSTSETSATSEVLLELGTDTLDSNNFDVDVQYIKGGTGWLQTSVATSGTNARIQLDTSVMECGIYKAQLMLDITLDSGSSASIDIPIDVHNKSLVASLKNVAPVVQYAEQDMQFTIHGCGFESFDIDTQQISGLEVQNVDVRSDFELEVFASPVEEIGGLAFTVEGSNELSLDVRAVPTYQSQAVSLPGSGNTYYDRSHDTIYVGPNIAKLVEGRWEVVEDVSTEDFGTGVHRSISDDGSVIYVIDNEVVNVIDAKTHRVVERLDFTELPGFAINSVSSMIDGSLIFTKETSQRDYLYSYDLSTRDTAILGTTLGTQYRVLDSADKSTSIIKSDFLCSCGSAIFTPSYETSNAQLEHFREAENLVPAFSNIISISQNAKRRLVDIRDFSTEAQVIHLYSERFEFISEVPSELDTNGEDWYLNFASLTGDGKTVYALYNRRGFIERNTNKMVVQFDVSNIEANSMRLVRSFDVTDSLNSEGLIKFQVSPDGSSLLLNGFLELFVERIPD